MRCITYDTTKVLCSTFTKKHRRVRISPNEHIGHSFLFVARLFCFPFFFTFRNYYRKNKNARKRGMNTHRQTVRSRLPGRLPFFSSAVVFDAVIFTTINNQLAKFSLIVITAVFVMLPPINFYSEDTLYSVSYYRTLRSYIYVYWRQTLLL